MLAPLQFGIPGGIEMLIILLVFFVSFVIAAVFVGRWIYRDAKRRGSEWAWQWGVGVPLLFLAGLVPGLLGVVIYLLVRGDEQPARPETAG